MILILLILIIFFLIIIIHSLNSNCRLLDFEFNIGINYFKLRFKTNEKSTPSDQE